MIGRIVVVGASLAGMHAAKTLRADGFDGDIAVIDADAQWYLHPSKRLLLCGTAKAPVTRTSRLSLREMVTVIEELSHSQR